MIKKLLCALFAFSSHAAAQPQPSPLVVTGTTPQGVASLWLDMVGYDALRPAQQAQLTGFVLGPGHAVDVSLTRFELFTPEAAVLSHDEPAARPDVQLWRGSVDGAPGSVVYLALSPLGSNGYVQMGGSTYIVSSGDQGQMPTVVYDLASPAGAGINFSLPVCGGAVAVDVGPEPFGGSPYSNRTYTCRTFTIAVDCDTEFTSNRFGGNHTNAQAYATMLMGAVSEIYQRDANMTLQLSFLRTWGPGDPYSQSNTSETLPEFAGYWQTNMGHVPRSLAHLLSARGLGGGIAYLRAACNPNIGFGVSANINGSFPYPLQDNRSQNWDPMVVAHELGHNFGTGHTHDPGSYNPIIDGCGSSPQNCTNANQGTIMSYCHTCSGGMSNIKLSFGTRVVQAMRLWLDSAATLCGVTQGASSTITQHPQETIVVEGQTAAMTVATTGQTPVGYQWKRNGAALDDGGRISGATSATLTIQSVEPGDAGNFSVTVLSPCGPVNSQAAWLGVITCPIIAQQPSGAAVTEGQPVTLTVNAGGSLPRTYQWRRAGQAVANAAGVTGATGNTLQIAAATAEHAGDYDVVVANPCGQVVSNAATVTVNPAPPTCGTADYDGDGDLGTDADIEAFFACLGGSCCGTCFAFGADFNMDGDIGTDADVEAFFRVLAGGDC